MKAVIIFLTVQVEDMVNRMKPGDTLSFLRIRSVILHTSLGLS